MLINITTLSGDGIDPEVTEQAVRVLQATVESLGHQLKVTEKLVGGAALLASNDPLPQDTIDACLASGAVLLGAVGGPAFDRYPPKLRPEAGLLRLRKALGVFANLRPAVCPGWKPPPTARRDNPWNRRDDRARLLGGIYFGERSTSGESGAQSATTWPTAKGNPAHRACIELRVAAKSSLRRQSKCA
jgi:3-isopropylmalate dehydrogenase